MAATGLNFTLKFLILNPNRNKIKEEFCMTVTTVLPQVISLKIKFCIQHKLLHSKFYIFTQDLVPNSVIVLF